MNRTRSEIIQPWPGPRSISSQASARKTPQTARDEILSVGILAGRVVSAASRVLRGATLDEADKGVLMAAHALVTSEAEEIRYAESAGTSGRAPGRLGATDFTLESILPPDVGDAVAIVEALDKLGRKLIEVVEDEDHAAAEHVISFFQRLGGWARIETGSLGDVVVGIE